MIYYCEERKGWMLDKLSEKEKDELYKLGESLVVQKIAETLVKQAINHELSQYQIETLAKKLSSGTIQ